MTTINTIEDLIRLLDENPEWREALRDRLLTRELIELPEQFAAFVEKMTEFQSNMATFVSDMTAFKDEMVAFKDETNERLERVEGRLDRIDGRLDRIQDDLGTVKGVYAQGEALKDSIVIADDMGLTWVRNLERIDLWNMSNTPEASVLSRRERQSFLRADLVIEARDQQGVTCYIPVEVSFTVNGRDTSRASGHARILTAITGRPAHPAVAGIHRDDRIVGTTESGERFWYELEPPELEVE